MNKKLSYDYVKEFYKQTFGIDAWVVEMLANMDILLLCSSGVSNEHIEEFLELDREEIVDVLNNAFGFSGWATDLPINPYKLYQDVGKEAFMEEAKLACAPYDFIRGLSFDDLQRVCETMSEIERRITDEWV